MAEPKLRRHLALQLSCFKESWTYGKGMLPSQYSPLAASLAFAFLKQAEMSHVLSQGL